MSSDTLIQQRGAIKGKLTRFRQFLDIPSNTAKISEIGERLKKVEPLYAQFEAIQEKIESTAEEFQEDEEEREKSESEYYALMSRGREIINGSFTRTPTILDKPEKNSVPQLNLKPSVIKQLSRQSVPKFDGELSKWIKFRDSFNSLVHNQGAFSNIDKFNYLNDALEGEAARAIQSLGISEANYEYAWKKLHERYEDSEELIEFHTRAFCELAPMTKGSYTDLRRMIDNATNHLAALRTLGESTDKCDSFLIYLMSKKLDDETKKQWNTRILSSTKKRTYDDFITVLENHCKYLQKLSAEKQVKSAGAIDNKYVKKSKEHIASYAATTIQCPQCRGNHQLYNCAMFKALSIPQRVKRVKEMRLCYNCLSPGHMGNTCSLGPCKRCGRRYNTLLHLNKLAPEKRSVLADNSTIDKPTVLAAQMSGDNVSHILLGTALIEIQDSIGNWHEGRALLDPGSQAHFITSEFTERVKGTKFITKTTVSGIHQSKKELNFKTILSIKSKTTGFKTNIACLITNNITVNIPNNKTDNTSQFQKD